MSGMQLSQITGNVELMSIGCMIAIATTREALRLITRSVPDEYSDMRFDSRPAPGDSSS